MAEVGLDLVQSLCLGLPFVVEHPERPAKGRERLGPEMLDRDWISFRGLVPVIPLIASVDRNDPSRFRALDLGLTELERLPR